MNLAANLKSLRTSTGMTQEQVAAQLEISRQAVARWESGDSLPDTQKLIKAAELYGVTLDELVHGKPASKATASTAAANGLNEMIVNQGLREAMATSDPEQEISAFLGYIGGQLRAERVYIFEENAVNGMWCNTYEWCAPDIAPQIDSLQSIPAQDLAVWLNSFKQGNPIFIYDIEDIRESDPAAYEWLLPQGITSLMALPLLDGTRAFVGADNPPRAFLEHAAQFIETAAHFIESMLKSRDLLRDLHLETKKHSLLYRMGHAVEYTLDAQTGAITFDPSIKSSMRSLSRVTCVDDLHELLKRHPECRDRVLVDGIEHVLQTRTGTFIEVVYYESSSHARWFKTGLCPVLDAAGNLTQIFGTIEDTTVRHEADERLAAFNEHFSGGMHICYLSDPIHLTYVSDSVCRLLGYKREEFDALVGEDYTRIVAPKDQQKFCDYAARLSQAESSEMIEYDLVRKDGSTVHVLDAMESMRDGNGIMYGYANVMDISQLSLSLEDAKARVTNANRRIARQLEVLEALSADYANIYSVNLNTGQAHILKLNWYVTAGMDIENPDPISYSTFYERYIETRVYENDQRMMILALDIDRVKQELSHSNEYSGSYRVLEDGAIHFYQFKFIRTSAGNSNVLAAFSNIDALMAREAARKAKLEDEINKAHALLQVFRSAYHVDLDNGTFTELVCRVPELHDSIGIGGTSAKAVRALCNLYVDEKFGCKLRDFLDAKTIDERLKGRENLTLQVGTDYAGWTEFYLIAGKRDEDGRLHDAYLATHSIEEQKRNEQRTARALAESRTREKRARNEANRDALTGVMNRRAYESALLKFKPDQNVGVIFCDVNGLKAANDNFGHKKGDELLQRFTRILRREFSDDTVYRIGGDEFVVLVPDMPLHALEQRFTDLYDRIYKADGIAAAGMAWGTGTSIQTVISQAEDAMYARKVAMKGARRA